MLNFAIIQFAPGGPIEQLIAQMEGTAVAATARISGSAGEAGSPAGAEQDAASSYRGGRGLEPEYLAQLERQFGFDQPLHIRFVTMMRGYVRFDFGESYFLDKTVIDLIIDKLPVSISLGLWTTLLIYGISIPLGIRKAVKDGSRFDIWSSGIVIIAYAVPGFLFAVLLIVLFAGGQYLDWFPLRGLTSPNFEALTWWQQITDYLWHITLPITAMTISGFASLSMLTKNSFLDQINQQYVQTARAKGLSENTVLYGHVFRNAMLIIIAGFPAAFVGIFFTGALVIETIFSLDGLGLLSFEALVRRDYPVVFGSIYVFTLLGLLMRLLGDITYTLVDPRIDFEGRA